MPAQQNPLVRTPVPKLLMYGAVSISAALAVIYSAASSCPNYYSAAVWIGKSNGSMLILANLALFSLLTFGIILRTIFFGPLRPVEVEHLVERAWYGVTESLMAMTLFRDEFGMGHAALFAGLLFAKCFHWILEDKVEWMEQQTHTSRLFHTRTVSAMILLAVADMVMIRTAVEIVYVNGPSMMIMFASEYMICLATLLYSISHYCLNVVDVIPFGGDWEKKSQYLIYASLMTDFIKLCTYVTFFSFIMSHYGLPLNLIRDVYITAKNFFVKSRDLIRFRRATKDMESRYPDANEEQLSALSDRICIICREEMAISPSQTYLQDKKTVPKRLLCGHIFHMNCLRSWLERQQTCPTCRRSVLLPAPIPTVMAPPLEPDLVPNPQETNPEHISEPVRNTEEPALEVDHQQRHDTSEEHRRRLERDQIQERRQARIRYQARRQARAYPLPQTDLSQISPQSQQPDSDSAAHDPHPSQVLSEGFRQELERQVQHILQLQQRIVDTSATIGLPDIASVGSMRQFASANQTFANSGNTSSSIFCTIGEQSASKSSEDADNPLLKPLIIPGLIDAICSLHNDAAQIKRKRSSMEESTEITMSKSRRSDTTL